MTKTFRYLVPAVQDQAKLLAVIEPLIERIVDSFGATGMVSDRHRAWILRAFVAAIVGFVVLIAIAVVMILEYGG